MIKKIALLFMLIASILFVQNTSFASEPYAETFYTNAIKQKIDLNWVIPHDGNWKSAVVSFTVNPDGSISNVSIQRSAGKENASQNESNERFDKSVVTAIYKSVPFEQSVNFNKPVNVQFFFSPIFTTANVIHNQALSKTVNVSNRSAYINFTDYTNTLQDKINNNWKPKKIIKKEKHAIARVVIDKDGSLSDFYILKSSRHKKFDRDIYDAIAKSVPFNTFPANIDAPNTEIQLKFDYERTNSPVDGSPIYNHKVTASVLNTKGYDNYAKQAEKILASSLYGRRCFLFKDLIVELKINKVGKLKYVKVLKPSGDKFNFDRKTLATLQKASFPPIPETIPFDDVTLNYEIVTQRGRTFHDFVMDYGLYYCTRGLRSFCLTTAPENSEIYNVSYKKEKKVTNDLTSDTYVDNLTEKIKSNWNVANNSDFKNKKAVASFSIKKDGSLARAYIIKHSGDEDFDTAAMDAIYKSGPFEAIPKDYKCNTMNVNFTFTQNMINK